MLYQLENSTDDLIHKSTDVVATGESSGHSRNDQGEWQGVRDEIRRTCMSLYSEVECTDQVEDIEVEKKKAQGEFKQQRFEGEMLMCEKGDKTKKKKRVIEESQAMKKMIVRQKAILLLKKQTFHHRTTT